MFAKFKAWLTGLVAAEVAKLFKEFEARLIAEAARIVSEKNQLLAELHNTKPVAIWKADDSTVSADHSLKVVK